MVKAPFPYFGGKQKIAKQIVQCFPPHIMYVDVFGGAASVLLAKPPSTLEVYNDCDSHLVNFFRVLRDEAQRERLIHLLELTPYAREEWRYCWKQLDVSDDPVEAARRWFVYLSQGFAGSPNTSSWRHFITNAGGSNPPVAVQNYVQNIREVAKRFLRVQIEHDTFATILTTYDTPTTLFYCDPPYVPETRRSGGYRYEMTLEQHQHLLSLITSRKGMVVLSGYDHSLYQEALSVWQKKEIEVIASSAGRTRRTGLRGKGAMTKQKRTECIWIKPNPGHQATLWDSAA